MKTSVQTIRSTPLVRAKVSTIRATRMAVVPRAEFLGSATNQIMILTTTLTLVAGRFGIAPTAKRNATAGLKLVENKSAGLYSNDPAGFTAADVLALGAFGHAIGVGIVLGLKANGVI